MNILSIPENNISNDYLKLRIIIRQLSLLITKARDRELSDIGITSVQSAVLFHLLHTEQKATIGSIAELMFIESHGASGLAKRMEEQGLIRILKPKGHRNRKYLKITAKGKRCYELGEENDKIENLFSIIPPEQCHEIIKSFQALRAMILQYLSTEKQ